MHPPSPILTVASIALLMSTPALAHSSRSPTSYHFNPLEHLAGVSPPFDPLDPPLNPSPPQGCNVTRAAYLVRHGAIYANRFDHDTFMDPFIQKLSSIRVDWYQLPALAFLATWQAPFTPADKSKLTTSGKGQATALGVDISQRYQLQGLRTPKKMWVSGSGRTVQSAKSLAHGLALKEAEVEVVEIYEGEEDGANSLTPYMGCPRFSGGGGSVPSGEFMRIYTAPPAARFNAAAPAFNFTANDIYAMSLLCGYETVIRGSSPFCSLDVLTPDEWLGFEYTNDLNYHYSSGYGAPAAGAVGFPWAQATFQALMGPQDKNSTATRDQDLFVSVSHRQLPPSVLVALGLFNNTAFSGANHMSSTMPTDRINHRRAWRSSHILPFTANVAIEKMECDSYAFAPGTYYRVLVNNSPQPLEGCATGPGESCPECELAAWLEGRRAVVGDFGSTCAVDYRNSTDVLGIYNV